MTTIAELETKFTADIAGLQTGINSINSQMTNFSTATQGHSSKISTSMIAIGTAVGSIAVKLGETVIGMGKSFLDSASSMEGYRTTLMTLYGDETVVGDKLKWIFDFAKSTPFEVPELVEATVRLKSYGIEGETSLRTIGDAASAMGKPVMSAVEAVADAMTGEFERLKEFGITTTTEAGKTTLSYLDKNGKQQLQVVDKSNKDMIQSTLFAIWNDKYAGGMDAQSKTFGGLVSNIKDSMTQAGLAIMGFDTKMGAFKPGSIFMKLKDAAASAMDFLSKIDWTVIGNKISGVVSDISTIASNFFSQFKNTGILESAKTALLGLGEAIGKVITWLKSNTEVINIVVGIGAAILLLTNPIAQIVAAAALLKAAWDTNFMGIQDRTKEMYATIKPVLSDIGIIIKTLIDDIIIAWNYLSPIIIPIVKTIGEIVYTVFKNMAEGISTTIRIIKDVLTGNWSDISVAISSYNQKIHDNVVALWNKIKVYISDAVTAAWAKIKEVFTAIWNYLFGGSVIPDIYNGFVKYFGLIQTTITTVLNAILTINKTIWNAISTFITTIWNAISTFITTTLNTIKTIITTVWNAISTIITTVVNTIKSLIDIAFAAMDKTINTTTTSIGKIIDNIWNAINTVVTTVVNTIESIVKTAFGNMDKAVTSAMNSIGSIIDSIWSTAKKTAGDIYNTIKGWWDWITGINWGSLTSAAQSAYNTVKSWWDSAKKLVSNPPTPSTSGGGDCNNDCSAGCQNDFSHSTPVHEGGMIYAANGWTVPGTGDTDKVPAMLTPGEFVIPKGMNYLNSLRTIGQSIIPSNNNISNHISVTVNATINGDSDLRQLAKKLSGYISEEIALQSRRSIL